ncbi:DUF262 domain-containing protein [Pseudomonas tritici]|uniref:DUF262 domain-containing protein n=1 Tax=Pseudomonas tritici TaxID=2745518 RepID=UPI00387B4F5F
MTREISDTEQEMIDLIQPLRSACWSADYRWDKLEVSLTVLGEDWGGFEMNPDFQRGHVWTPAQQVFFVENCLRGIVGISGMVIQFNCRNWSVEPAFSDLPPGLQCVDGLQRFTAINEFVKGNVKPFGLSADELKGTQFSPNKLFMKVEIHDFSTRAELLSHYLSINAGGTPHSADEITRVRELLTLAKATCKV